MKYNPENWYWVIAGDDTKFWSSAKAKFVDPDDPDYVSFVAAGGSPTPIASIENLASVFAQQYPGGMLTIYANVVQWTKAISGYHATVGDVEFIIPTSVDSMCLIGGKVQRLSMPNPPTSVNWQTGPTSFVDIPASDFIVIATQVADLVQSTFDTLKDVFTEIQSGTITTREQIDEAFA